MRVWRRCWPGCWQRCRPGRSWCGWGSRRLVTITGRLTMAGVWPQGWQIVELNPAHVSAQRRVNGQRGVKTDRVDLAAIADLLLAGRGSPVVACGEPTDRARRLGGAPPPPGRGAHATKNQLLAQLDRAFPACAWRWRTCWAPRWACWSPRTSPIRRGWPGWGRNGSAISLLAAAAGSCPVDGLWSRPHWRQCLRRVVHGQADDCKLTCPARDLDAQSAAAQRRTRRCCRLPDTGAEHHPGLWRAPSRRYALPSADTGWASRQGLPRVWADPSGRTPRPGGAATRASIGKAQLTWAALLSLGTGWAKDPTATPTLTSTRARQSRRLIASALAPPRRQIARKAATRRPCNRPV